MTVRVVTPRRDDPAIRCPRHDRAMRRFDLGGVQVDRCPVCGGIWMDAGELERIVAQGEHGRDDLTRLDHPGTTIEEADHEACCPRDGAPLVPRVDPEHPGVEFDVCGACRGVFFDAGELSEMTRPRLRERLRWLFGRREG